MNHQKELQTHHVHIARLGSLNKVKFIRKIVNFKPRKLTFNDPLNFHTLILFGNINILWNSLLAPRVGASKRILAPRLGNGIPLYFIFALGANNLLVGKRLLAPRVGASKSKEILAPRFL